MAKPTSTIVVASTLSSLAKLSGTFPPYKPLLSRFSSIYSLYLTVQENVCKKHLNRWLAESKANPGPRPIMMDARYCNMDTSLRVFCGPHIPEHAAKEINDQYWAITLSLELVNFPLALPGTKVYRAIQSRKNAMKWLELAAHKSKIAMAEGGEPECMLDQWVQTINDPTYKGGRKDFSDYEMAQVLFSFLFASQDAMSSGLIYGFQHLVDHPEILRKVREEQERVRMGDYEKPLTLEMMDEMVYLQAVVKESMRVMPPVTMVRFLNSHYRYPHSSTDITQSVQVPYKCTKAYPITPDYTVPVNSMVIPSFYPSLHDPEIYENPDEFIPERWLDPNGKANANPKNYLVYGAGPHRCLGLEYANMNIALTLATAAVMMDFVHDVTPLSKEIE